MMTQRRVCQQSYLGTEAKPKWGVGGKRSQATSVDRKSVVLRTMTMCNLSTHACSAKWNECGCVSGCNTAVNRQSV